MLVQYNIDRSFKCCVNMVNIKKMLKWSDIVAVKFPAITSLEIVRENINQSFRIDGKDKLYDKESSKLFVGLFLKPYIYVSTTKKKKISFP